MSYESASRFQFEVLRRCVLPRQEGGMQTLSEGDIVCGAHYARFIPSGCLKRLPPAAPVPESAPVPDPVPVPAPAPASDPIREPIPALTPPVSVGTDSPALTRADLERMTKKELREKAGRSGSKDELIRFLLDRG